MQVADSDALARGTTSGSAGSDAWQSRAALPPNVVQEVQESVVQEAVNIATAARDSRRVPSLANIQAETL